MSDLFRFQADHNGNEIEPDALDREMGNEPAPAVQINSQAHKWSLQQGSELAEAHHLSDAQSKIDTFQEELDRIEVLRASGERIDDATRRHIRGTMEDVAIAWVDRAGGSLADTELEALRARVGSLIGR